MVKVQLINTYQSEPSKTSCAPKQGYCQSRYEKQNQWQKKKGVKIQIINMIDRKYIMSPKDWKASKFIDYKKNTQFYME